MKPLIQTNKENQQGISTPVITSMLKPALLLLFLSFLLNASQAQYIFTAKASTAWNVAATWTRTGSGGANTIPAATDSVIIAGKWIVTIPTGVAAVCRGLVIGTGTTVATYGNLTFTGTSSLTVTNAISFNNSYAGGAPSKTTRSSINPVSTSTITCGSINEASGSNALYTTQTGTMVFTGTFTAPANLYQFENLSVSSGTTTFNSVQPEIIGNLSVSNGAVLDLGTVGATNPNNTGTLTLAAGSKLKLGGVTSIPGGWSIHSIAATSTIEYYGANQTVSTPVSSQSYGNLIISGTGIKTLTGSIGIAGNLTLNATSIFRTSSNSATTNTLNRTTSGGTLTINNGATLRITGSGTLPANFAAHAIGASSTIEFSGTSPQVIPALNSSQSYGNLNVFNEVKTLSGNTTVAGTLTISAGSLVIASNTLSLGGDVIMGADEYFTGSAGSNLTMTGAFDRYIYFDYTTPGTTDVLNNLTLNHTGNTTYLASNLVNNGALTFTAGKLDIAAASLTVKGNIVNTVSEGLVGNNTGTLIINGTVSPTISMDQTTPGTTNALGNLEVNCSGQQAIMGNDLQVDINATFTAGKLAINGNTLTLNGDVTNTVAGGLKSSSTSSLVIGGGLYSPTLSFDQSTPGTTNVIQNVTVNSNSQTVSLSNTLRLLGTHTPMDGVFESNGNYTIASTASSTANIAAGAAGGGYITGDVKVERFIPQNTNRAWRLLTSPTSGQTINQAWQENQSGGANGLAGYGTNITNSSASWAANGFDFQTPSNSILSYDVATNNFVGVNNTSLPIANEPGYLIYIRGNRSVTPSTSIAAGASTTLRTTGTLYTGDQPATTVTANKLALIGNPYASAIDLRNITLGGGSIGSSFYVWDPKLLGSYNIGGYQTLTESGGNYIVVPGGGSYGSSGTITNTIESGAAFFVQAVGSAGTIAIDETSKATGSRMVFRPAGTTAQMLNTTLFAKNNGMYTVADGAIVLFDASYSNAIDGMDNKKLNNLSETFSIVKDGANLVAEKRQPVIAADTVAFKMIYMKKIDYKLQVVATNMDRQNMLAFLEDSYTASSKALNMNDTNIYEFTVDNNAASYASSRFRVVFKPASVLSVSFTNVHATEQNKKVLVEWQVAQQVNIASYIVEKSADGRNFTRAAVVNAGSVSAYSWLDETPLAGYNYYRIKSIEVTGEYKQSSVVKVSLGKSVPSFSISPNPAEGNLVHLQFTSQPVGKYQISITNAAGQVVYKTTKIHAGGSGVTGIALPATVSHGAYQLEIIAPDNSRQVQKLLIR